MKLVIFDCDGTLVDSQHMIVAAMEGAFDAARLPRPAPESVRGVIGLSLEGAIRRLLAPGDEARAVTIAEDYKSAFRHLRERRKIAEPLYPGVREALIALASRDDVLLAIATGKSRRGVHAVLEREGLSKHFVSIQTADEHPSKPDPSMILRALDETGADEASALMVGDTTYDMEMAVNAGIHGIGVSWGYHPRDALIAAGAAHVFADSTDLGPALLRLLAAREVMA